MRSDDLNHSKQQASIQDRVIQIQTIKAQAAFDTQRSSARHRGIEFLFTFHEWWEWWQIDERWNKRGLKGNGLVMARFGDEGPYAPWNVYCATSADNVKDIDPEKRREAQLASWAKRKSEGDVSHLTNRATHPKAKSVMTPEGLFESAALAADYYRIDHSFAQKKARKELDGWRYVEKRSMDKKKKVVKVERRNREVVTPQGIFPSCAAAGLHYGVVRQTAYIRAKLRERGWHFSDTPLTEEERLVTLGDYPFCPRSRSLRERIEPSRRTDA